MQQYVLKTEWYLTFGHGQLFIYIEANGILYNFKWNKRLFKDGKTEARFDTKNTI